jgi:hypothetical protein
MSMGGKPEVVGQRISCKLGSQAKMRFVGGAFCPVKWLPIEVTVEVMDRGVDRQVIVSVSDRLGIGLKIGFEKRYRDHVQQTASYVRQAIAARFPQAAPVAR